MNFWEFLSLTKPLCDLIVLIFGLVLIYRIYRKIDKLQGIVLHFIRDTYEYDDNSTN